MYLQMIGTPPQGAGMDSAVATEAILQKIAKTKNNQDFLESLTEDQ
jgi:transcription termination factor Rho